MRFWWVNHNKTHKEEINGEFIWSPKVEKDGRSNNSYNNMPKTSPGDIIFSFADAKIKAVGIITIPCETQDKPESIIKASDSWSQSGWYVGVQWDVLKKPFRIKENINKLKPFIKDKYSPIQKNGTGNQKCYLAEISFDMANMLFCLAEKHNDASLYNEIIECEIETSLLNFTTEKTQIIKARKGQGIFKKNVKSFEVKCRVTSTDDDRFLIASHIKPWRYSTNEERLDGENGLLLAPHIDKLFDNGWISFSEDGELLISSPSIERILVGWKIPSNLNVGSFTPQQKTYLKYHREFIFK